MEENECENAVCKIEAILSRLECVNTLRPRPDIPRFINDISKSIV